MQVHAFAVLSRTFGPSPSHTAKGILLHNILYIVLSFPLALMQHNDLFDSEELVKVLGDSVNSYMNQIQDA